LASVPRLLPWAYLSEPGNGYCMVEGIRHVVELEGSVHIDVQCGRLRDMRNIARISKHVSFGIDDAIVQAGMIRDGYFLLLPDSGVTVRTQRQTANGQCISADEPIV
jgi:hypothetical protein